MKLFILAVSLCALRCDGFLYEKTPRNQPDAVRRDMVDSEGEIKDQAGYEPDSLEIFENGLVLLKPTKCEKEMRLCGEELYRFLYGMYYESKLQYLREKRISELCQSAGVIRECSNAAYKSNVCKNIRPDVKEYVLERLEYINKAHDFVCIDLINDIEEHKECIFNPDMINDIWDCVISANELDLDRCGETVIEMCATMVTDKGDLCKPGAKQLVSKLFTFYQKRRRACRNGERSLLGLFRRQMFL